MKYTNTNANPSIECAYKDVVVIGNGPSGITLSYMLAGNWPHWNPQDINNHPDELLRARLECADPSKSLVEQDLVQLAEGLEGRSTNPVSLLLDSLQNPCADIGLEVPSMLCYRYQPDKEIDHVVLGTGAPGGSWHKMDPNLRTLSLAAWMSLPGLDFNTWNAKRQLDAANEKETATEIKQLKKKPNCNNKICENNWWRCFSSNRNNNTTQLICEKNEVYPNTKSQPKAELNDIEVKLNNDNTTVSTELVRTPVPRRVLSVRRQVSREVQTRALVSDVAQYYENYVKEMNLERYFHNNTLVTCVKPILSSTNKHVRWLVRGIQANGTLFAYTCHNVVLANGASDLANRLGVSGEGSNEWVKHDLPALLSVLEQIPDVERPKLKPVLVVGAGLSAADAVTICKSSGINVIHVYRNRSAGLDKMLPETVYPEYHEVHKMMKDSVNTYDLYAPMPEHTIIEFIPGGADSLTPCHKVVLKQLNTGEITTVEVSYCAILIGFRPDLQFLDPNTKQDDIKTIEYESCNESNYILKDSLLSPYILLSRKIAWLKNLCAKCKHLSICERSRKYNAAVHRRPIHCTCTNDSQIKQNIKAHNDNNNNNNNNNNVNSNCDNQLKDGQVEKKLCGVVVAESKSTVLSGGLGEDSTKPVDCKTNPMAVDKYTNEVLHVAMKGLFAMGPLVGDNFIRFIPGGALAITAALWKQR
ncbi:oxidative stress-induced growth inhibitor 2-like [Sitodiplosis mosellana]|uniref:oxidative stress-induced growth inhibitor 2-like n=1 Tax=Sitodiplosis mosellana TaxID=263140 RepID=UPI002443F79D|nr:oxidative stress-induced growth inhibitor 2-like [Sitodiplosis mosellana]XP_055317496.1 oxidative stress-induced growth inhibitor 2-like [Sitodiplosis mosellana]XP_055317497.1 oxidative stress-induced growth inhibitor 2-like [Sitodiplosis mosellana]